MDLSQHRTPEAAAEGLEGPLGDVTHEPAAPLMRALLSLFLLVLASAASADTPMSAAEFEAYVEGRTLYYGLDGQDYGAEEYLPNRRVRWSFLDGACLEGRWYEADDLICFVYETLPDPQCWSFFRRGGAIVARFENGAGALELYQTREATGPLMCLGPEVGV